MYHWPLALQTGTIATLTVHLIKVILAEILIKSSLFSTGSQENFLTNKFQMDNYHLDNFLWVLWGLEILEVGNCPSGNWSGTDVQWATVQGEIVPVEIVQGVLLSHILKWMPLNMILGTDCPHKKPNEIHHSPKTLSYTVTMVTLWCDSWHDRDAEKYFLTTDI